MYVSQDFIPPEQREQARNSNSRPDVTTYQYSKLDYAKDAAAALLLMGTIFVMIWVAFAMDVITTGM